MFWRWVKVWVIWNDMRVINDRIFMFGQIIPLKLKYFVVLGPNSFQEHGNRMLMIWLHGLMIEGSSPAKSLHEALVSVGITKIAGRIYFHNFIVLTIIFVYGRPEGCFANTKSNMALQLLIIYTFMLSQSFIISHTIKLARKKMLISHSINFSHSQKK